MENPNLTVKLAYTKKDLQFFTLIQIFKNPVFHIVLIFLSLTLLMGTIYPVMGYKGILIRLMVFLGFYLLILIIALFSVMRITAKRYKVMSKEGSFLSISVDETGFMMYSKTFQDKYPWQDIDRVKKVKLGYVFTLLNTRKILYPKKFLNPEFVQFLDEKIGQNELFLDKKKRKSIPNANDFTKQFIDENEKINGNNEIIFTLTSNDLFRFSLYKLFFSKKNYFLKIIFFLILIVPLGLSISFHTFQFLITTCPIFLIIITYYALLILLLYFGSRKRKIPIFVKYFLLGDKIKYICQYGDAEIEWENIYVVKQTRKTYYLFISKTQALIVPKNNMTESHKLLLEEIIKTYKLKVKKNKRK